MPPRTIPAVRKLGERGALVTVAKVGSGSVRAAYSSSRVNRMSGDILKALGGRLVGSGDESVAIAGVS
jgi:hypothetical protein